MLLCPGLVIVSPLEAALLARITLGGTNDNLAVYLTDTLPRNIAVAQHLRVSASISLRNDGWNVLNVLGVNAVVMNVTVDGISFLQFISQAIAPGASIEVSVVVDYPGVAGEYILEYALQFQDAKIGHFQSPSYLTMVAVN